MKVRRKRERIMRKWKRRRRRKRRRRSQLQCSGVVLIANVIVSCFPVNKAEEREKNADEEE